MSNVLSEEKKQQVLALGRLGWSLRRIEETTTVRRETAGAYLKAAGIAVRGKGGRLVPATPATLTGVSTDSEPPKPASLEGVSTDSRPAGLPGRAPSASACEPFRELITAALTRGRNAVAIWQELVDEHGFQARYASVSRHRIILHFGVSLHASRFEA